MQGHSEYFFAFGIPGAVFASSPIVALSMLLLMFQQPVNCSGPHSMPQCVLGLNPVLAHSQARERHEQVFGSLPDSSRLSRGTRDYERRGEHWK